MAVRSPLKNDSGNVKEMTSAEVDQIVDQIVYQYSLNPSVSLSVISSGGSLGTITDTRLQAGAMSQTNSSFPTEAQTAEPSVVTVNYDKVNQSINENNAHVFGTEHLSQLAKEDITKKVKSVKVLKDELENFRKIIG